MVLARGSPAAQLYSQDRAGRGGEQDEHPTPLGMGGHSRARTPRGKGWGVPGATKLSWMLILHLSVGQQAPRWGRCHPLVPQEGEHLVGYIFPSRVKSCPTYLGLRLPRRASQAVQTRRAKWARPELLNPSPELPAGCCSPPAAGSVLWPGLAGRGAAGSPLAFAS